MGLQLDGIGQRLLPVRAQVAKFANATGKIVVSQRQTKGPGAEA